MGYEFAPCQTIVEVDETVTVVDTVIPHLGSGMEPVHQIKVLHP